MHDLRYDPADPADAHAPDLRERKALDPADLRTVPMSELRSAEARIRDAHERGLDCRTFDEQVIAELVRLVDVIQALSLRQESDANTLLRLAETVQLMAVPLDVILRLDDLAARVAELERTQAATIAGLEAYIRDHSESDDVPLAMAEDAWGVG